MSMINLKQNLLKLFDGLWLPALLLASPAWLYAPWVHRVHYGQLEVISSYETNGMHWALLFKLGDIIGGLLIIAVIWRVRLIQQERRLGWTLLLVALLIIVDDVFLSGCLRQCSTWMAISLRVHDIESVLSVFVLVLATGLDIRRRRAVFSQMFLALQLGLGVAILLPFVSHQLLVASQYVYQTLATVWIAYILQAYSRRAKPIIPAVAIRAVFATLVVLAGLAELVLAFHVRAYGNLPGLLVFRGEPLWLAEHSVIVGLLLLYLSRYIYKGERRAAILIIILTSSLAVKYSLLAPDPGLLLLAEIILVAAWVGWPAFDRNVVLPSVGSKLQNLAITVAGVVVAGIIIIGLASSTGRGSAVIDDGKRLLGISVTRVKTVSDSQHRLDHRLTHIRYVSSGLGIGIIALAAGSLFKPLGQRKNMHLFSESEITALLERYAGSSEDYFKLWPADKAYFADPTVDGFIAYKKVSTTLFALADPVCPPALQAQLLAAFMDFARQHGWSVCFLLVSEQTLPMYKQAGLRNLQIGSSAVVDIEQFSSVTVRDKWWRWQLNRAKKAGLQYETSSPPHSSELLKQTQQLSELWLQRAGHSEQGFALGYYDRQYLQRCTLHLLRDAAGQLVAFANELPIYHGLRQTTVDLIRFQPDVNGAMPVLIANLISGLPASGQFDSFDIGFVPLAKIETKAATVARRLLVGRFSAAGLEQFKGKFKPDWQPQHLVYEGDVIDLTVLLTRLQRALKA